MFKPAPRADAVLFSLGGREFGWASLRGDLFVVVEIAPRFEIAGIAFGAEGWRSVWHKMLRQKAKSA
ncbi:MAG: hypothetical protein IPK01_11470 [Acidobacteria bacterium]|nr:hypothetical protein [Acidobacteriota bacterium]